MAPWSAEKGERVSTRSETYAEGAAEQGDHVRRFGLRSHIESSVYIDAPPEAVWEVVADVTRSGQWSGECLRCQWLGGATGPVAGARFAGHNEVGRLSWNRVSEILVAERPRELAWRTMPTGPYRDSTEWRIRLQPDGRGTRLSQDMQVVRMSRPLEIFLYFVNPPHRDRTAGLLQDLHRLKAFVEGRTTDNTST